MTKEEFHLWYDATRRILKTTPEKATSARQWAEELRPHDPALADLYVRQAENTEAMRAHVTRPK